MAKVIGVRFEKGGKLYFFDPLEIETVPGGHVIVETAAGMALGEVCTAVQEFAEESLNAPLKPVLRTADENDVQHEEANRVLEHEAYGICQQKIADHKLDMKLVSAKYTFDNNKILFYFTANGRVDFRGLVKDLAATFRTRIELRQIGVRDEARMLGGLGACGRTVCCRAFLGDFQPVSIKMAKEQNLSLNPTKISGVCGRLMCCLKYEEDDYEETRRRMPRVGKEVVTPDGSGTVSDLNIITERVKVRIQKGDAFEIKEYALTELARPGMPAPQPEAQRVPAEAAENPETPKAEPGARGEHRRNDRRRHPHAEAPVTDQPAEQNTEAAPEKPERRRPEPVRRVAKLAADKPERPRFGPRRNADVPAEQPQTEQPKAETSKPGQPKTEQPKHEQPKPEQPKAAAKQNNWKAAVEQALKAAGEGK